MFLLDTCTVSDIIKNNELVIRHYKQWSAYPMYLSAVSCFELEYGFAKNLSVKQKLNKPYQALLQNVEILNFNKIMAAISGDSRSILEKKSPPIGPYDILIAATALAHNLTLVTSNTSEFQRIPDLKLKNWRLND